MQSPDTHARKEVSGFEDALRARATGGIRHGCGLWPSLVRCSETRFRSKIVDMASNKKPLNVLADVAKMTAEELRQTIKRAEGIGSSAILDLAARCKAELSRRRFAVDARATAALVADVARTFDAIFEARGTRASYAERDVRTKGITRAISDTVNNGVSETLRFLAERGMLGHAFESIIARHPDSFDEATRAKAAANMAGFK